MSDEMSTTKMKEVIWEENASIEPKKKSENNGEFVECDITINIKNLRNNVLSTDTTKISGIYKIVNKQNNMYYVGSSDHILRRWKIHQNKLNRNRHENPHLQNAWNKYGKDAFDFVIIKTTNPSLLLREEQKYLDVCKTHPLISYNISYDAIAPMRGRVHLPKSKQRISETHIGKLNPMFGKHHGNIAIAKIKERRLRQVFTKKHRETQSIAQRKCDIYTFYNHLTKKHFTGTQFEFRQHTHINPYYLLKQLRTHYCGWSLTKC